VIDVRMPVLNGLDAAKLIKDQRPATQVVVLSAFESPELERQAREAGAFAYLDKGTMAGRVRRVLLGAAVQAVLDAHPQPPGDPDPRPAPEWRETF
jgi:DNA-binding NarL/FixJ family response regulator